MCLFFQVKLYTCHLGGNDLKVPSFFRALTFVYPYGATLSVIKPAVAVLSTGSICFPLNRPVLAFYQGKVSRSFILLSLIIMFVNQNL